MTAAVFLWGGLALVVAAVWLLLGQAGGAVALGTYGAAAAAAGAAAMRAEPAPPAVEREAPR